MKHLILAVLSAGSTSAVQFMTEPVQTFYTSQHDCDLLVPPNNILHYEFNQEACGCWLVYDFDDGYGFDFPTCLAPTDVFNPYSRPFLWREFCITQEDYDGFFDHGLGLDCIPGSGDELTFASSLLNDSVNRV